MKSSGRYPHLRILNDVMDDILIRKMRLMPSVATVLRIQSVIRGFLGRKVAGKLKDLRGQLFMNRRKNYYAREIQRHVRGFLTRRNVLDSRGRARFITGSIQETEKMKLLLEERYRLNLAESSAAEAWRIRELTSQKASRSHHLVSTRSIPGVCSAAIEAIIRKECSASCLVLLS